MVFETFGAAVVALLTKKYQPGTQNRNIDGVVSVGKSSFWTQSHDLRHFWCPFSFWSYPYKNDPDRDNINAGNYKISNISRRTIVFSIVMCSLATTT
jgi:hypothetical protein